MILYPLQQRLRSQYDSLSVGLLSKVFCIKEGIQQGKKRFEFLKGNEIYKQRLGGKEIPLPLSDCHCLVREGDDILRIAMLSAHSCPVGQLGTRDTGGMSVYISELAREFGKQGHKIDIFTSVHDPRDPLIESLGEMYA